MQFVGFHSKERFSKQPGYRKRERTDKGNNNSIEDEFIPALYRSTNEFVDTTFDGDTYVDKMKDKKKSKIKGTRQGNSGNQPRMHLKDKYTTFQDSDYVIEPLFKKCSFTDIACANHNDPGTLLAYWVDERRGIMGSLFIYKSYRDNISPNPPPLCSRQALISEEFQRENPYELSNSIEDDGPVNIDKKERNNKSKQQNFTSINMNNSIIRVTLLLENLKGQLYVAVSANIKYNHLIFFLENRSVAGKCTLSLLNTKTMKRLNLISKLGLSRGLYVDESLNICFIEETEVNMNTLDTDVKENKITNSIGHDDSHDSNKVKIVLITGAKILSFMKSMHTFENPKGQSFVVQNDQNDAEGICVSQNVKEKDENKELKESLHNSIEKQILLSFPGKPSKLDNKYSIRIEDVALLPDKSLIVASQCSTSIYQDSLLRQQSGRITRYQNTSNDSETFSYIAQSNTKSKTYFKLSLENPLSSCPHAPRLEENLNISELYQSFVPKNREHDIPPPITLASLHTAAIDDKDSLGKELMNGTGKSVNSPSSRKDSIASPSSRKNSINSPSSRKNSINSPSSRKNIMAEEVNNLREKAEHPFIPQPKPLIPSINRKKMQNYLFSSGTPYPPLFSSINTTCNKSRKIEYPRKASVSFKYSPANYEVLCDGLPLVRGLSVSIDSKTILLCCLGVALDGSCVSLGTISFDNEKQLFGEGRRGESNPKNRFSQLYFASNPHLNPKATFNLQASYQHTKERNFSPLFLGTSKVASMTKFGNILVRTGKDSGELILMWKRHSGGWGKTIIEKYRLSKPSFALKSKYAVDVDIQENFLGMNLEEGTIDKQILDVVTANDRTAESNDNKIQNKQDVMEDKWNIALYTDEYRRKKSSVTGEKELQEIKVEEDEQEDDIKEEELTVYTNVVLRCRPLLKQEKKEGIESSLKIVGNDVLIDASRTPLKQNKMFSFDQVYNSHATQAEIYAKEVAPAVDQMLQGYSTCVIAYGQTGAGKTYTMEGSLEEGSLAGMIPRAVYGIFNHLHSIPNLKSCSVYVSHIEIYNENIYDLFGHSKAWECIDGATLKRSRAKGDVFEKGTQRNTHLKETSQSNSKQGRLQNTKSPLNLIEIQRNKFKVLGVTEVSITSPEAILKILKKSIQSRTTAETLCNRQSSRSHSIFTINVKYSYIQSNTEEIGQNTAKSTNNINIKGKVTFVDLSGSENIKKSGAEGIRQKEASNIGQSLLAFSRVITARVYENPHVPYRDSKLTKILSDSLGGNGFSNIILNVTPAHNMLDETISTLHYACLARRVISNPRKNVSFGNKRESEEDDSHTESEEESISNAKLISNTRSRLQKQIKNLEEAIEPHLLPWAGHVPIRQNRALINEDERAEDLPTQNRKMMINVLNDKHKSAEGHYERDRNCPESKMIPKASNNSNYDRANQKGSNQENKAVNILSNPKDNHFMIVNANNTSRKIYDDISNQWIRTNVLDSNGVLQSEIKKQVTKIFNDMINETSARFHHNFDRVRYIPAHDTLRLEAAWYNNFSRVKLRELNAYKGYGLTLANFLTYCTLVAEKDPLLMKRILSFDIKSLFSISTKTTATNKSITSNSMDESVKQNSTSLYDNKARTDLPCTPKGLALVSNGQIPSVSSGFVKKGDLRKFLSPINSFSVSKNQYGRTSRDNQKSPSSLNSKEDCVDGEYNWKDSHHNNVKVIERNYPEDSDTVLLVKEPLQQRETKEDLEDKKNSSITYEQEHEHHHSLNNNILCHFCNCEINCLVNGKPSVHSLPFCSTTNQMNREILKES